MEKSYLNIIFLLIIAFLSSPDLEAKKVDLSKENRLLSINTDSILVSITKSDTTSGDKLNNLISIADTLLFNNQVDESLEVLQNALETDFINDYTSQRELKFKIYDIYSYQWDFTKSIPAIIDIFKADSLRNDLSLMANSSSWVASTYSDNYDVKNSKKWIDISKTYATLVDSTRILAYLNMLDGDNELINKNLSSAFEKYQIAESYIKEIPISNTAALINLSLATIYSSLNQVETSINYYNKTIDVYNAMKDYSGVALAMYNLAILYGNNNDYTQALHYALKSIDICKKESNEFAISDMLVSCYSLVSQLYERQEDWENSLKYLELSDQLEVDNTALGTTIEKMCQYIRFYTKLNNYEKAAHYVKLSDSLKTIVLTPPQENDFLNARLEFYDHFSFYKEATAIARKLINNIRLETSDEIANLVAEFEAQKNIDQVTQEKQKLSLENTEKNLTIANQYKTIYSIISLILFISSITIFIYYRYKAKTKLAKLLNFKVDERTRELKIANEKLMAEIDDHKATTNQLLFAQRLTGVGEIASGIAHEIRNPLTNIIASMQILKSRYPIENDDFTNIIIRNVQNANERVVELLNYSQPIDFKLETVALKYLIQETISLVQGKLNKDNIKLQFRSSSKQDLVSVDKKQISTVFLNFILNSIDAINSTNREGLIEISMFDEFNFVVVEFKDNGCGIKASVLPKIFQPFFTNKKSGTGLGLNLAHRIIHQHGGIISANSEADKWTTITVKLLNIKS